MTTVLIMAGGTGGHVYPALSVAEALLGKGIKVVWLGTRAGLESKIIPDTEIPIEWLSIRGLTNTSWRLKVIAPLILIKELFRSLIIVYRNSPDVVLGMGGYVTGPGGIAARILRRPLIIHESNMICGLTNRVLSLISNRVLVGFSEAKMPRVKAITTGNPLRKAVVAKAKSSKQNFLNAKYFRILILGGSQGARAINQVLPSALEIVSLKTELKVIHQTGAGQEKHVRRVYEGIGVKAEVVDFIDDIGQAYLEADLVVARAGAMTISELCLFGLPAILLPYPHAADDHQTLNAEFLSKNGAAIVISSAMLKAKFLAEQICQLIENRFDLERMSENALLLANSDGTDNVVSQCLELANA